MLRLRKLPKPRRPLPVKAHTGLDRRLLRYHSDAAYREEQVKRARRAYRVAHGIELDSCLRSLAFLGEIAKTVPVKLPSGRERTLPVLTLADTALALQTLYQTVWRWLRREQIPAPLLGLGREFAYHIDEVRVLIEEIGQHQKVVTYYRRDHRDLRERIFRRIGTVRKNLKLL